MALTWFACANCGFWQKHFAPPDCPVCTDVRNDLPEDGWHFLPEADVTATHDGAAREVAPGLWAFTTSPALGLAGTGWLIVRDDLKMTKAFRVTAPFDDTLELAPGYTLHHVGGHYEGQAALHDAPGRRLFCGDMFKIDQDADGRSHAISSHKAFHKDIPLTHAELRRYRDVVAPLDFDAVLTPFEYAPEVNRTVALAALDDGLARAPGVRRISL
jgi:hypothetical protein